MNEPTSEELLRLSPRLRHRQVGAEGVLIHLDSDRVIVVNEVGLYVVQALQQPMTRQALLNAVISEFDVGADAAAADLQYYLQQLTDEQLLATPGTGGET